MFERSDMWLLLKFIAMLDHYIIIVRSLVVIHSETKVSWFETDC